MKTTKSRGYRADIDGLRALAILSVVAYHAKVPYVTGGFTGVDVFFVISGFLISQVLFEEIGNDKFRFATFYARRVRRIVPALLFVAFLTTVVATAVMPPQSFKLFGESLMASAIGVSNMLFLFRVDYFTGVAEAVPFLHTWSLGVEEQFYVVFPVMLVVVHWVANRMSEAQDVRRRILLGSMVVGWVLSVVFTVWVMRVLPTKVAFYILPTRDWELLTGAVLASGLVGYGSSRAAFRLADVLGTMLLGLSFFYVTTDMVFPGLNAMYGCLGAALLIWAGEIRGKLVDDPSTRFSASALLGSRPLVFVGLISYSLYLLHWPALVLTGYIVPGPVVPGWVLAVVVAAVFPLSAATWHYVEKPFRNPKWGSQRAVLSVGVASLMACSAVGAWIVRESGAPQRLPTAAQRFAAGQDDFTPYREKCKQYVFDWDTACKLGAADVPPNLVVWGDSMAFELSAVLAEQATKEGTSLVQATLQQCPAAQDFSVPQNPACPAFNKAVLAAVIEHKVPQVLLVSSYFEDAYLTDELQGPFAEGMDATVRSLVEHGTRVYLMAPIPDVAFDVPQDLAFASWWNTGTELLGRVPSIHAQRSHEGMALLDELATKYGASIIYPERSLCEGVTCLVSNEGQSFYWDDHHLSMTGARWVLTHTPELHSLVLHPSGL